MISRSKILIFIGNIFKAMGLNVRFHSLQSSFDLRLSNFLSCYSIDNIYDIGANHGQFIDKILSTGFTGNINCYEPIPSAIVHLEDKYKLNKNISVFKYALSDNNQKQNFYVTHDSPSSSLLKSSAIVKHSQGRATISEQIEVEVKTLDSCDELFSKNNNNFMKIDVQGSELSVLQGATATLESCQLVLIEISFTELYIGQPIFNEVLSFMLSRNYKVIDIFDSFRSINDGAILQADVLFSRK
jgi:FkbM family methyltransferase